VTHRVDREREEDDRDDRGSDARVAHGGLGAGEGVIAETLGMERMETIEELTPDHHPRELAAWLNERGEAQTVAVVGHEPHLGEVVTWLLGGNGSNVEFKKGGASLLRIEGKVEAGAAVLIWHVTPAQLRGLAD
jgi:phosphohistidine phosphatase